MGVGLFIFLSFITLLIIAGLAYLFIILFVKKEEPEDATIALNLMSHFSNGRFLGKEVDTEYAKDGRIIKTIEPKDLLIKKGEKREIKKEKIILMKNRIVNWSRGSPSKERNISLYLPKTLDDLSEDIKKNEFGLAIAYMIKLKDVQDAEIAMLREGNISKTELLKKIADGELTRHMMHQLEEMNKDFLKSTIAAKDKETKTQLPGTIHNE